MNFDDYSDQALRSDSIPLNGREKLQFLVLGLNEEAGEIARLIKKQLRNDLAPEGVRNNLKRKIGDVLWYLNSISAELGLQLSDIAQANLAFTEQRWLQDSNDLFSPAREPLSEAHERFPDSLILEFHRIVADGLVKLKVMKVDGDQVGDVVDDNERTEDGYRFHDVIHLALVAHFGWSPVFRKLLKLKRKTKPTVDRVEDGAKARDVEEAICRKIFTYMEDNAFLVNITALDTTFLTSLRAESRGREISNVTERQWELTILNAAHVIRQLMQHNEGYVVVDTIARQLTFRPFDQAHSRLN